MDTNNFLSFSRITMVIKRDIMENWKTNIYRFIAFYVSFALLMIWKMWMISPDDISQISFNSYCATMMGAFTFIIGIGSLVYAADIMENMTTKEKRINFLMLPATMIEKFVARSLIVTIGFALSVVVAASLAEITRYLVLPLFSLPDEFKQSVLYQVLSMFAIDGEQAFRGPGVNNMRYMAWLGEACGWSFLVWSHSLYILGGSYWYKKPFLKTIGVLMLFTVLGSIIMVQVVSWVGGDGMRSFAEWLEANFQWMTLNKLLSLGVTFFTAFTLFNWWLSYKLFTCSQIIKPKFRLL